MSKQMETSTLGHKSSGVVLKDITKIFQQPDTGKDFVAPPAAARPPPCG